jgi:hypothetical protein
MVQFAFNLQCGEAETAVPCAHIPTKTSLDSVLLPEVSPDTGPTDGHVGMATGTTLVHFVHHHTQMTAGTKHWEQTIGRLTETAAKSRVPISLPWLGSNHAHFASIPTFYCETEILKSSVCTIAACDVIMPLRTASWTRTGPCLIRVIHHNMGQPTKTDNNSKQLTAIIGHWYNNFQ